MPVVQKVSRVDGPTRESSRIWYPTVPPTLSHLACVMQASGLWGGGRGGQWRYGKNQRLHKRSSSFPVDGEAKMRRDITANKTAGAQRVIQKDATTYDFSTNTPPQACSHLSDATLSATPTALILLGCVQMMLHFPPSPRSMRSSSTNWGTCVVFPHPVSPLRTTTCDHDKAAQARLERAGGWGGGYKRPRTQVPRSNHGKPLMCP